MWILWNALKRGLNPERTPRKCNECYTHKREFCALIHVRVYDPTKIQRSGDEAVRNAEFAEQ